MTNNLSRVVGKLLLVGENTSPAADIQKNAKNQSDSSLLLKKKIMKNDPAKPRNPTRIPVRRREAEEVFRGQR